MAAVRFGAQQTTIVIRDGIWIWMLFSIESVAVSSERLSILVRVCVDIKRLSISWVAYRWKISVQFMYIHIGTENGKTEAKKYSTDCCCGLFVINFC